MRFALENWWPQNHCLYWQGHCTYKVRLSESDSFLQIKNSVSHRNGRNNRMPGGQRSSTQDSSEWLWCPSQGFRCKNVEPGSHKGHESHENRVNKGGPVHFHFPSQDLVDDRQGNDGEESDFDRGFSPAFSTRQIITVLNEAQELGFQGTCREGGGVDCRWWWHDE